MTHPTFVCLYGRHIAEVAFVDPAQCGYVTRYIRSVNHILGAECIDVQVIINPACSVVFFLNNHMQAVISTLLNEAAKVADADAEVEIEEDGVGAGAGQHKDEL